MSIRRVDERLGLAIDRAALSGRTLVTYARDHVAVRTPSRPDFRDGNTIDLLEPPAPEDLPGWIDRFGSTVGVLGARHVQVRWEQPLSQEVDAVAPSLDPALAAAFAELGFEVSAVTMLLLDVLVPPEQPSPVRVVAVDAPSAVPGGAVDRHWHAASVLYRYETGSTPVEWRAHDEEFTAWAVDVQRELATAGRAQVWLATRHGAPVGRCTLSHDRQGLAVVSDVVVHPVHRRIGVASTLTEHAVAAHLAAHPDARVGLGADPGSSADRLYRRLGFRPHATVWTALRR